MKRLIYFLIFLNTIYFQQLKAQGEISLLVEPDTNILMIGEHVNLNITIRHPKNVKLNLPDITENIDPKLEIVSLSEVDTSSLSATALQLKQSIVITSFDTGISIVPPLPFEIDFGKGRRKDTLFSRPVYMLVLTMALDTSNNIFDIKPQYPMKFTFYELVASPYFYISLGAILLAILVYFLYHYLKPKEQKIEKPQPKIPAHVIAISELDLLKSEKLWQQNKTKEYYSRLTEIIRHYIELRFNVKALEQTSTDILTTFRHNKLIDGSLTEHLSALLSLADLVKFAKGTAMPDENEKNMESAYDFVRKTKQTRIFSDGKTSQIEKVEPLKNDDNDA